MSSPVNPLSIDSAFLKARTRVQRGDLGQRLAIYAVIRAKARIDDALTVLGLPLIQEVLSVAEESHLTVTSAYSGGDSRFEQWSLILSFPSGVRASIDIASGLGAAQARALDLRVEWSGAEQAILVDPTVVAVTVTTGMGQRQLSAEVTPLADALFEFAEHVMAIAANPEREWTAAAAVIEAAKRSQEIGQPIAAS